MFAFWPSVVLSVKRWMAELYICCRNGLKHARDPGIAKNVLAPEYFSKEQWAVKMLRTNKGLIQKITAAGDHPGNKKQYSCKFYIYTYIRLHKCENIS